MKDNEPDIDNPQAKHMATLAQWYVNVALNEDATVDKKCQDYALRKSIFRVEMKVPRESIIIEEVGEKIHSEMTRKKFSISLQGGYT